MEATIENKPRPLSEWSTNERQTIKYVFADIDDTMTNEGKLGPSSFESLWRLHDADIGIIPVTGRPAGWCDAIARQWPVIGVMGENGALAFWESNGKVHRLYHDDASEINAKKLDAVRDDILQRIPESRVAGDQFARLFDLAIDFAEELPRLSLDTAKEIQQIFVEHGATAKVSSIHVNGWFGSWDKQSMVQTFGREHLGLEWDALRMCSVYVGDSPNDEPLFKSFDSSIGVANVVEFLPQMQFPPTYVTQKSGGFGFAEAIDLLLEVRKWDP